MRFDDGMTESTTAARTVDVEIVAAFTKDGAGGNLAGVVLDAEHLSHEQRQRIATEVALSETSFVRAADDDVFEVAFYTPNKQVPDCGHATVRRSRCSRNVGCSAAAARRSAPSSATARSPSKTRRCSWNSRAR